MSFINPPTFGSAGDYSASPNYALGSVIPLQWQGAPAYADLWLFQDGGNYTCKELNLGKTYCFKILPAFHTMTTFNWTVQTYGTDYPGSVWFYFSIRDSDSGAGKMLSHYFSISQFQSSSSTTSTATTISASSRISSSTSASTSTSISTSTSTSTTTSSSPSTTPTQATQVSPVAGLDSSTKVAVGCALGIGIPLIVVLALIAFFLHRNRVKRRTSYPQVTRYSDIPPKYPSEQKYPVEMMHNPVYHNRPQQQQIAELGAR